MRTTGALLEPISWLIRLISSVILLISWLTLPTPAAARVVRVEIEQREDVLAGRAFGRSGAYEKIIGTAHFAVARDNAHNRAIIDLDRTPTNAASEVEFTADLYILRPKDPNRGNGSLFMEIPNRGGKGMLTLLNRARGSLDPTEAEHFGDGFLLRQGFTLVWLGWQFDTRDQPGLLRLHAPVAAGVRGLVRSDFIVPDATTTQALGHVIVGRIGGKEYPVADAASERNVLTVRDRPNDPRQTIPRDAWHWTEADGVINGIEYAKGFEPGRIYELIYEASDPALVGLGLAAVRDFAAYAKHDAETVAPVERAIGFGISQSGRFLRHFLYQGFNADEEGRQAFDGIMAHVAGAGRGSFNHRFAQPSRDGQPMEAIHYPTDLYPFTDVPTPDPVTIRVEGLLDRASRDGVLPKIFHTNTSYEYWGRAGSLIHTRPDGKLDVKVPPNVRIYHLAGVQHFQRPLPPSRLPIRHILGRYVMNPNPSAFTLRALVVAMQNWVSEEAEPPASRYPRLDDGTLVPFETVQEQFPAIPGVERPRDIHTAFRMDYGPEWWNRGIISQHPPKVGQPFPVFVPAVDADGNERGGVRIPQLEAPVATYTAWNLRDPSIGAASERVSFLGAYFPFPKTAEARQATGDPRPSLAERYPTFEDYLGRYTEAALRLLEAGFLRPEDLDDVIARGRDEWGYAQDGAPDPAPAS
ncbi:MAG: alpha/beta hydrolase domain-containing protein [Acidobacteriota bacterium]